MTTIAAPICYGCKRFRADLECDAFPDGIPQKILLSEVDHRLEQPDDQGIQFEPVDKAAAAYAEVMFGPVVAP